MANGVVAANLDSVRQERLSLELLRLALRNLKPNCWLMPLLACVVCVMFARWISVPMLIFWLFLVTAGGGYLGVVAHCFMGAEAGKLGRRNWLAHAAVGYMLFAASWASLAGLLWRPGDDLKQMLILLLIACTLAGNAALVGASTTLTMQRIVRRRAKCHPPRCVPCFAPFRDGPRSPAKARAMVLCS